MSILSCALTGISKDYGTNFVELLAALDCKRKGSEIVGAVIIIFAVICLIWAYANHVWQKKKKVKRVFTRSLSIGVLHGGELALQRLVEYHDTRASLASEDASLTELQTLLERDHPDFKKLQSTVTKLEMQGNESMAVKELEAALQNSRSDGKSQESYEFEMLLVESLIYKGDFERALKCQCLYDESISDARRPFYKAIIYILLEHPREQAKKYWKEFKGIRRQFHRPHTTPENSPFGAVTSFSKFENLVKLLKEDIIDAKKDVK